MILVRRVKRFLGHVEATHKNSMTIYKDWIRFIEWVLAKGFWRSPLIAEVTVSNLVSSEDYFFCATHIVRMSAFYTKYGK